MTPITLLRCREQAGERFRTTQTSSPHPAGTGICLRTARERQSDPRGLTKKLEQFLYILNLLDCSTAAPVSRVCSRACSVNSPPRSGGAAVSSSHTWEALHAAIEANGIQIKSLQASHRCIGQGFRELVRRRCKTAPKHATAPACSMPETSSSQCNLCVTEDGLRKTSPSGSKWSHAG